MLHMRILHENCRKTQNSPFFMSEHQYKVYTSQTDVENVRYLRYHNSFHRLSWIIIQSKMAHITKYHTQFVRCATHILSDDAYKILTNDPNCEPGISIISCEQTQGDRVLSSKQGR